jgi:16S rRNA (guanine966-N2)-methyltransferase
MRITGGIHRSRALRAPPGSATRPTSDRVREALFGILTSAGAVEGARVLDLYAGTGALGLESLSRGAATALLVESSRAAAHVAQQNVESLGLTGVARILGAPVERSGPRIAASGPFDLVLADPPWALVDSGGAGRALVALVAHGILAERGLLVLEHASRTAAPELEPLSRGETRTYGDTALTFYKNGILGPPSPSSGANTLPTGSFPR